MGMLNLQAPMNTVETGSMRDAYMKYMEDSSLQGVRPMPFPEFVKMMQLRLQQQQQQQQQQPQMNPGGLMFPRQ